MPIFRTQAQKRLKAHALSVVQPGFSYFHQNFTIDLAHEMQLLKYARLCNYVRIREIRPTPQQLDDLNIFKCISVPQPLVCLSGLKSELPIFLALAQDLHAEDFQMNDILPFFCSKGSFQLGVILHACLQPSKQIQRLWNECFQSLSRLSKKHKKNLSVIMFMELS